MDKPIAKFEYTSGVLSNTHYWTPISKVFRVNLTNNCVNLYFKRIGKHYTKANRRLGLPVYPIEVN